MATHDTGFKMPSRPAPRVPPTRKPVQNSFYESPPDPFSPPKMKLDFNREKRKAPPRPPPPQLNTNQGSNHFRSIFGSSKRNPKKSAATAIVKPLPRPNTIPAIPTGTLIDLQTPPSSPKSLKSSSDNIWYSGGNVSKNSSPFESGFEDDFSSILSSATTSPSADIWSDLSPDKSEHFDVNPIKYLPPPSANSSRPTIICLPKAKPSRPPPPKLDGSPPMPTMPPPPPPADLLQVLANGPQVPPRPLSPYKPKDDTGFVTCTAQYDYESSHPDDLQFKAGDVITVLEKESEEWLKGRLRGREGMFPVNYVSLAENSQGKPLMKVIALFSFIPGSWDDLELQEGDLIDVLDRVNDDWLYGECMGKHGQFPECYVQDITALAEED